MTTMKRKILKPIAAALLALPGLSVNAAGTERLHLDKQGLTLSDAQGRMLDQLKLRAKRWDQRPDASGPVAVLLDADRGRPLLARARSGKLLSTELADPGFEIEALCLHRDAQGLLHLFLLGKAGLSEQWLLGETSARPLRRLASPLEPDNCQVNDASGELRIREPGVGLWAYGTEAEGKPQRRLLKPETGKPARQSKRYDWPVLQASAQTEPVARLGDAADDPAIWVHPGDAAQSLVLGTNKKQGLLVYDLQGRQLQLLEVGRLNNVDLRQGIQTGGQDMDLAVATQRDENSLLLFGISTNGQVSELARLPTDLKDIYGVCVGKTARAELDVHVNDKDGRILQYRVELHEGTWRARLLRQWKLASQPEGCVVDEREQRLFVGEEKRGIWALDARADRPARPQLVMAVGGALQSDVEGLALYRGQLGGHSYLVVSSQGNHSYLVLDAKPPFALRGGFRIGINAALAIDGTSETDGIEVSSAHLGAPYEQGMLVVQDGHKRLPEGPQNFKYLPWSDVARALKLP